MVPGRLVRRYKRFLADVRLDSGPLVIAHCPNPGAMTGYKYEGMRVYLSPAEQGSKRKLKWTWELARPGAAYVLVNTARANPVVAEALHAGRLTDIGVYESVRAEQPFGVEGSRVDFVLQDKKRGRCFVEVKNVTFAGANRTALFPDAVTERGRKHLRELMHVVDQGDRAVLLYLLARADCDRVSPADPVDPAYGRTLRQAAAHGVELLAYRADLSLRGLRVGRRVDVVL